MIAVYTHSTSLLSKEFWKHSVKSAIGKYSGPDAVRDSMMRGLQEHNISFELDPQTPSCSTAVVLSGTKALSKAISLKEQGVFTTLLAGPNLVITPHDADGILSDPRIDHVLVPSQWVADFYRSVAPQLSERLVVWPAGVAPAASSTREPLVIVYMKSPHPELADEAVAAIHATGLSAHTLRYGSFSRDTYFELLGRATAVIYISPSESQGLALQEAWIRNVPTFVHHTGRTETAAFTWEDPRINAPYLEDTFGAFYRTMEELRGHLQAVAQYSPRERCVATLSDRASTELLLPYIR